MFFKRAPRHESTFADRIDAAKAEGFTFSQAGNGLHLAVRKGCAGLVQEMNGGKPEILEHGILAGKQVARLVHGGYQMFFLTADGHKYPAQAEHLTAVHAFYEDLSEALGIVSLYNTSLGSTSSAHLYDRVENRDLGEPKRPWETE